jgi:hypothetical protein
VGELVFEVFKLVTKGVFADGAGAHICFARGSVDHFCGAAVVREAHGGSVFVVGGWYWGGCEDCGWWRVGEVAVWWSQRRGVVLVVAYCPGGVTVDGQHLLNPK